MKWPTTTLLWLAYCARGFEPTERSDKMRPIFTETRGRENHERPRRQIPQFRGANHTESRVRKLCANPLRKGGNRGESARDFRAFALFALSITSVCGGAKFSQALMFSSPLLLLRRQRKRKRIIDASAVESGKPHKKQTTNLNKKTTTFRAREKKAMQGPIHTAAEWAQIARETKGQDLWSSHTLTQLSLNRIVLYNERGDRCPVDSCGAGWNTGLTRSGAVAMATNHPSGQRISVRNTRRNSQKSTAWIGHAKTKCPMNYQQRTQSTGEHTESVDHLDRGHFAMETGRPNRG